jgi:hypothetical protein
METITKELLTEEAAGTLGYVDDSAAAAQVEDRCRRACEAVDGLPEGWTVERVEERTSDVVTAVEYGVREGDDYGFAVARRTRAAAGSKLNHVQVTVSRALMKADEAQAVSVAITLAAIDAEARTQVEAAAA